MKCSVRLRLLNNILLTDYKNIIDIICSNRSVRACIFEPQLVEPFWFLKIIRIFQQPKHRRCLSRVENWFNFLPWKLIFYVAEKVHHCIVCKRDYVHVSIFSIISHFYQLPVKNKIQLSWVCEQVLRFNIYSNLTRIVEISASNWLVTVIFLFFNGFINLWFFSNVKNVHL